MSVAAQRLAQLGAAAFVDVVRGDTRCSADGAACCAWGFPAARGWDAASGLGVPSHAALSAALEALPCIASRCDGGRATDPLLLRLPDGGGGGGGAHDTAAAAARSPVPAGVCRSDGKCHCAANAYRDAG